MKIYLESKDKRYDDRIKFIEDSQVILKNHHDITFVNEVKNCDVYMTHQTILDPDLDLAYDSKKPIIILQRSDSANIASEKMRDAIKKDIVKGFFKITNFKDKDNHNKKTSGDKRYHLNFINTKYKKSEYENIFSDKELRKIQCALPAFYNFRFKNVRNFSRFFDHQREYDLNFAGIVDYSKNKNYVNMNKNDDRYDIIRLLNEHRKNAYDKVLEYGNVKNKKVIAQYGKPFTQPQYWQTLLASSVCLSPWGFGGYNWRDYETIYLGGILIKPDTDFLESYCNLYDSDNFYFKCQPNFEDLIDIVFNIMKDYDKSLIKTRNAQKLLYESYNIDKIAKRFALQIKNCFKE
jgi:hypothetical protein